MWITSQSGVEGDDPQWWPLKGPAARRREERWSRGRVGRSSSSYLSIRDHIWSNSEIIILIEFYKSATSYPQSHHWKTFRYETEYSCGTNRFHIKTCTLYCAHWWKKILYNEQFGISTCLGSVESEYSRAKTVTINVLHLCLSSVQH